MWWCVCFFIITTFFLSLACLHYAKVNMETLVLFLLTLGRCRGAAPPPALPPGYAQARFITLVPLELHLGGPAYGIGHVIRASVYLLPGEPHLTNWVGVPPPGTEASGSDATLPPRARPLGINTCNVP